MDSSNLWARERHISLNLKVGERINIGGVSAPVIRTMVGPNFARCHRGREAGGAIFHIGPMMFLQ